VVSLIVVAGIPPPPFLTEPIMESLAELVERTETAAYAENVNEKELTLLKWKLQDRIMEQLMLIDEDILQFISVNIDDNLRQPWGDMAQDDMDE
jgi:hypothetical protein